VGLVGFEPNDISPKAAGGYGKRHVERATVCATISAAATLAEAGFGELAELVRAWPHLPPAQRAELLQALKAIQNPADAAGGQQEGAEAAKR